MKKLGILALLAVVSTSAFADGQVFYRYGFSSLKESRGGQTFTDVGTVLPGTVKNDDKSGHGFGAGLDLKLMACPLIGSNSIVGEIFVDYNKFSKKYVLNAIDVVAAGSTAKQKVTVSELAVVVAPKYRIDGLGKLRPWVIPAGLAFLVNSPPSNTTSYLDVGYHVGAGAEYMILKELSLGVDYRYTFAGGDPGVRASYGSLGLNLGVNF